MQKKTNIDNNVLAFQQWLKDTYGDTVDLGVYGVNGNGVDGKFGAKTKALWDKYGDKYSESQKLIPIGTQKIKGTSNIPDLSNLKKISNNSAVTDALNKARAEYSGFQACGIRSKRFWRTRHGRGPCPADAASFSLAFEEGKLGGN